MLKQERKLSEGVKVALAWIGFFAVTVLLTFIGPPVVEWLNSFEWFRRWFSFLYILGLIGLILLAVIGFIASKR